MSATGYAGSERDSTGNGRTVSSVPDLRVSYHRTQETPAYEINPATFEVHPASSFELHYNRGNGYWMIWDAETAIYGYGRRLADARRDFQVAVVQHLDVLESEDRLSEELAWQLEYLRARVRR